MFFPTFWYVWLLLIRVKCYFLIHKQQLPPFILINLLVKTFSYPCCVINISVHTNETGQSSRRKHRDISLSSTSSYTQRTWIKWTILDLDRLFNPLTDDGSLFPDDSRSEDAGLTPPGKLQPICIHAARATVHKDTKIQFKSLSGGNHVCQGTSNNRPESVGGGGGGGGNELEL